MKGSILYLKYAGSILLPLFSLCLYIFFFLGCSQTDHFGTTPVTISFSVPSSAQKASQAPAPTGIASVALEVTASDMEPIIRRFNVVPGEEVTIDLDVPAGAEREFQAKAFDDLDNIIFQGVTRVDLQAGVPVTVQINMVALTHTLTVAKQGTGGGVITSSPAGINCRTDCSETYINGTKVTLTAAPAPDSIFDGWSGGGCTGTGACTITIVTDATITAKFTLQAPTLTVAKQGTGGGVITSSPAGINCGTDCQETYNINTSVMLTATPDSGSFFAGWGGDADCPDGAITMDVSKTCMATFNLQISTSGSLDTSFGAGGKVITAIGTGDDFASDLAMQADGKIVVVGHTFNGIDFDFAIIRYDTNGNLDASFGTGGKVITSIGSSDDLARSLAIQADGKLVVAGRSFNGLDFDFTLVRYNTDGTLDTTFGIGGKVTTAIGTGDDFASALAIQADGKIVVAGHTFNGLNFDFAIVRYNTDGTLDTTFGTVGKTITPIGSSNDLVRSVAIQADGKLVVAGDSDNFSNAFDFAIVRYNTDGTLDTTFGTGGKVITSIGSSDDFASDLAIQADGKIVVAGHSAPSVNGPDINFAIIRYDTNGNLDTSFGTGGIVTTSIGAGADFTRSLAIRTNGQIVVAGDSFNGLNFDFALTIYKIDGTLDTSFGAGGIVTTAIGAGDAFASALVIQADGKIVVAGHTFNGLNFDFALVRYMP